VTSAKWLSVALGESIASEGKGDYLYVEGSVLDTSGKPIAGAVIETWETDSLGTKSMILNSDGFADKSRRLLRHSICRTESSRLSWTPAHR
jgi:protocatechuate 3,4-dioxygenase beta subunit